MDGSYPKPKAGWFWGTACRESPWPRSTSKPLVGVGLAASSGRAAFGNL